MGEIPAMYMRKDELLAQTNFIMTSVIVVGAQWGDEGKGKLQIFFC